MTKKEAKIYLESVFPVLNAKMQEAIKALCTEQEPRKDEVILTNKEYRELVSNEYENGYAKGYREALEQEPLEAEAAALQKAYNKGFNDCRQAAIDIIDGYSESQSNVEDVTQDIISDIMVLSPVNPQEPKTEHPQEFCDACEHSGEIDGNNCYECVKDMRNNYSPKKVEPKYCDRNICISNEYNGIGCNECEVTKGQDLTVDTEEEKDR